MLFSQAPRLILTPYQFLILYSCHVSKMNKCQAFNVDLTLPPEYAPVFPLVMRCKTEKNTITTKEKVIGIQMQNSLNKEY